MKKCNFFFVCFCTLIILFSFMFLACPFGMWDNTVRDSLLHDYEITYSPHKELYTIDDEIEITLTYEKLKAYYHSLTIDVTGGEYISEKSNWVSDKNISVRDKASGVAVLNRKLSLDLDTTSDNDRTFVVTPKKDEKYTINFSLTADCKDTKSQDIAYEKYTFEFTE